MLKIKELYSGYNGVDIIKNVNLQVDKGEILFIIGPNGCGKSTLLKSIANLIEYRGTIKFDGVDSNKYERKSFAQKVGLMSQLSEIHFPYTIYETVSLGRYPYLKGAFSSLSKEDVKIILDSIEKVGLTEYRDKMITELSLESENCLYKIVKDDKDKIILNEGWKDYLQKNYKVIKGWIYYKIVCFLQKRNPNVPAIAFKIEAPKSRNLTRATTLWKEIIISKNINDIYTGMDFTKENYDKLGVLSIDHFIPWSFVLHDEMWNLTPTFKNINSSKSDNLPSYQEYIDKFCSVQYEAFSYLCDKKKDKDLECYIDVMRLENPFEFLKYKLREEFNDKLKQTISPIYQIALNQGFEVLNKVY